MQCSGRALATSPETIRGLNPGKSTHIIVTTRWTDWAGWATEFPLEELSVEAAADFLLKRTGREDRSAASGLAESLGCLPLALDHAGAYLKLSGISFAAYSERILKLIAKFPPGSLYPQSVAATFELAINKASEDCPSALAVMNFCSVLGPLHIPTQLAAKSLSSLELIEDALLALASVSLLKHDDHDEKSSGIVIHRLVQAVSLARIVADEKTESILWDVTAALLACFPKEAHDPATWALSDRLFPHVMSLRKNAEQFKYVPVKAISLFEVCANYLYGRGMLYSAEQFLVEAIALWDAAFDERDENVAVLLSSLGHVQGGLGKFASAEPNMREGLRIVERKLGKKHLRLGFQLNRLGHLLWQMNRNAEALPILRRALRIGQHTLGPNDLEIAFRTNNLGNVYREMRSFDRAERLYRKAIAIAEKTIGRDHFDAVVWLNNLANLLSETGRRDEAEPLYLEAIAGAVRCYGNAHPDVAKIRLNYTDFLVAQGKLDAAFENALVAYAILKRFLGDEHELAKEAAMIVFRIGQLMGLK